MGKGQVSFPEKVSEQTQECREAGGVAGQPAPAQALAIEHASGPIQVLAGPGSGKTYLTIRRIRHLICHHGISPDKILVITFTKAAALEMEERFFKLTDRQYTGVTFGTFHAVYFRILRQSGYGGGRLALASAAEKRNCLGHVLKMHGIMDTDNELLGTLFKEISRQKNNGMVFKETGGQKNSGMVFKETSGQKNNGGNGNHATGTEDNGQDYGKHAQKAEDNGQSHGNTQSGGSRKGVPAMDGNEAEEKLWRLFPVIFREYCSLMEEMGKLDFDDMIYLCGRMLAEHKGIREYWQNTFSHILVDEFQDISPLQYQVIKQLAAPEDNLFVVGDDDQSIYGFRGAGPGIMRRFMEDYPEALQLTLDKNYRSAQHIVRASLLLIAKNKNRFAKEIRAERKENGCVVLRPFKEKEDEERHLAGILKNMSREEQGNTAVICRTNAQLSAFSRLLAQENIPFCCRERIDNLFSDETAKDFLAYLQYAADTCGDIHNSDGIHTARAGARRDFLRIMNRPCRYIQRCALDGGDCSERALREFYRQKPYMQDILGRFFADLKKIAKLRPYLAIDYLRKRIGYDSYLCEGKRAEERQKLLEKASEIQQTAAKCRTLKEWLEGIAIYTEKLEENAAVEKGTGKGVQLVTMHGSKGLEYDTVFLPQICARLIPGRKAHTEEELEEERRIFYVAMTRAKYRLEISYHKEPSPFLDKWDLEPV